MWVMPQDPQHSPDSQIDPAADVRPLDRLSIIIPSLNAGRDIARTLLSCGGGSWGQPEITVIDGGSADETMQFASALGAKVITSERARGHQLRKGAKSTEREWMLFLHADTELEADWAEEVAKHLLEPANQQTAAVFRYGLADAGVWPRALEMTVAFRSKVFALPYGDQGLLIHRDLYFDLGGYRPIPIMEDVDFVRRIGRRRLHRFYAGAITSAARYQKGYGRRVARNQICLALYFLGVSPRRIARLYG
jgi:rSAM/selenodomain-associated transferase 2